MSSEICHLWALCQKSDKDSFSAWPWEPLLSWWTDISGPAWAEAVLDALEPDAWDRVRGEVLERLHI